MTSRRDFLRCSAASAFGVVAGAGLVSADDRLPDGSASKGMITPATQTAIDRGLAYLARSQKSDGSFGQGQYGGNVAVSSLAALAFMSGGHQPGRGLYGKHVTLALDYVLGTDDGRGFLISKRSVSHGPMYGHGFGTLFLAEVYGMVHDREMRERLKDTLKRAIKLIVDSQNVEGGWRYQPGSRDADVSVTICQIMALRAARNAGFYVPKSTVDRCTDYVKKCQGAGGGFQYQTGFGPTQFARSAAGLVALHCAGIYKGREVQRALDYLTRFKPGTYGSQVESHLHYFYGHYYAAQAMWTAGGKYWSDWYPAIRDELLNHPQHRSEDGCWQDQRFSDDYGTAMACIILQIPNNYLPILQK